MIGDVSAVSDWHGFGRAVVALLIRDLALTQRLEVPERFLEDELLAGRPDDAFFEHLLADAATRYAQFDPRVGMSHAALACRYAQRYGWAQWRRFLPLIFASGERAGDLAMRRAWAREGLEGEDVDLTSRAICHDTLGRCLYDEERFAEARRELELAVELAREADDAKVKWRAMTTIVAACQLQGDQLTAFDWAEQAEAVARALDEPFELAKTLTDRGNIELHLGNYDAATKHYREALAAAERGDIKLWQSNTLGNLGNVAMLSGDARAAEEYGRRALAISVEIGDRESEQFDRNNLAQVLRILDRHDEAIEMERQALRIARERNDDKAEHYREVLRRWYVDAGDLAAARALDEMPGDVDVVDDLAPPEAATREETVDDPEVRVDPEVDEALGRGDFGTAEQLARRFAEERPDDWRVWFQLGVVLSQSKHDDEAVRAYDVALKRNPLAIPVLFNQINAMRRLDRLDVAFERFRAAVEDDPLDPMARVGLGRIHFFRDEFDDAIRTLRESIRLRPAPTARLALAQALTSKARSLLTGEFDRAWAVFEEAAAAFTHLLHDHGGRGELYSYAAMAFQSFAEASYRINPPLIGGIPADELVVFGHAIAFYDRALKLLGSGPMIARGRDFSLDVACSLGTPRELALAAQRLAESGVEGVPLAFLMAAVRREEQSGEPHYQLAMLLWHGMEGKPDLRQVEELIEEAVQREPENEKFAAALRALKQPKPDWQDALRRRLTEEEP